MLFPVFLLLFCKFCSIGYLAEFLFFCARSVIIDRHGGLEMFNTIIFYYPQEQCCGVEAPSDWYEYGRFDSADTPDSCCRVVSKGCGMALDEIWKEVRRLGIATPPPNPLSSQLPSPS